MGEAVRKKFFWKMAGREYQPGNAWFVHRQQGLFLSVYVDDSKMSWRKHDLESMWKRLMKHVDLEKPTTFLDQV